MAPTNKTRAIQDDTTMIVIRLLPSLSFFFLTSTPKGCIVLELLSLGSCPPPALTLEAAEGGEGGNPAKMRRNIEN